MFCTVTSFKTLPDLMRWLCSLLEGREGQYYWWSTGKTRIALKFLGGNIEAIGVFSNFDYCLSLNTHTRICNTLDTNVLKFDN